MDAELAHLLTVGIALAGLNSSRLSRPTPRQAGPVLVRFG